MASAADPNQANDFPADAYPLYAPHQPHDDALQTWVSFDIRSLCLLQVLICRVSFSRPHPLPPPANINLKTIEGIYFSQSCPGLMGQVECKIHTTSTWPIRGPRWTILDQWLSVTSMFLPWGLLLIDDTEPHLCVPRRRTRSRTTERFSGY
jgi:hypothetical protein